MKKKTGKRGTYDTDRYELRYHVLEDMTAFYKSLWASPAYVGPESYNNSHIDRVIESNNNRASDVMDCGYNPFITNRGYMSQDSAKFKP
jgi:hypothetical protein